MPFKYFQEYELEGCLILNFLNYFFFSGATVILDLFIRALSSFLTSLVILGHSFCLRIRLDKLPHPPVAASALRHNGGLFPRWVLSLLERLLTDMGIF